MAETMGVGATVVWIDLSNGAKQVVMSTSKSVETLASAIPGVIPAGMIDVHQHNQPLSTVNVGAMGCVHKIHDVQH